jgi:hypothetical protein
MDEEMTKAELLGFLLALKAHLEAGNTKEVLEIIDRMIKHIEN